MTKNLPVEEVLLELPKSQLICGKCGGTFKSIGKKFVREFGKQLHFYAGVPDIFKKTKDLIANIPAYQEHGIKVEHYIVSTGFVEVIRGYSVMDYVDGVWGCELKNEY